MSDSGSPIRNIGPLRKTNPKTGTAMHNTENATNAPAAVLAADREGV